MMYMPSVFGENLLDDWMPGFDDAFFGRKSPLYGKNADHVMKTDIRETDENYEVDMDLPGFKKEEIQVSLENGYLSVSANKGLSKEETEKKSGKVIRRERYTGGMTRSFYVGDALKQEDIKARFEDGVLRLLVPKKEKEEEIPESKYIAIEG